MRYIFFLGFSLTLEMGFRLVAGVSFRMSRLEFGGGVLDPDGMGVCVWVNVVPLYPMKMILRACLD